MNLDFPLTSVNMADAVAALTKAQPDVAMLVDARLANASDPDAIVVGALVAIARGHAALATRLVAAGALSPDVLSGLHLDAELVTPADRYLASEPELDATDSDIGTEVNVASVDQSPKIESWLSWVEQLQTAQATDLDLGRTQDWAPAWIVDAELAGAIDALPQIATDALLSGVAASLDADDPSHPR